MSESNIRPLHPDRGPSPAAGSTGAFDLPHGGGLSPTQAWPLIESKQVVLVDVRTAEERQFVGRVEDSLHVPWAKGTALNRNPRFVRELAAKVDKEQPVLLICRSGRRSALAVGAAIDAGFAHIANVLEGFEGDIDGSGQRGHHNGWRFHGLPWVQE